METVALLVVTFTNYSVQRKNGSIDHGKPQKSEGSNDPEGQIVVLEVVENTQPPEEDHRL